MYKQNWQRIKTIVNAALLLPKDDRENYLTEVCFDDDALRREIEELLLSIEISEKEKFMDRLTLNDENLFFGFPQDRSNFSYEENQESDFREAPGSMVGPYKLIEKIGRGGMGTVWLVSKSGDPYQVQAALKLVRRGVASDDVIRRFHHEGQILSALEHPNIARLYDGGVHEDGRPYFVMEYIKGEPVDVYCNNLNLSIDDRLRLFMTVCDAVHHAHQNLIVHRDIKPAHVIVTKEGEIKLLDFGIAKILEPDRLKLANYQTRTGIKMMTPEFAAPEQVRGVQITTASDIYSLGVLLYLLLTGRRPYRLETSSLLEMERIVCEYDPLKPSEAVYENLEPDNDFDLSEVPVNGDAVKMRSRVFRRLSRKLAGDLDRIVLMALRKEPENRYRSALAFAEDLDNYLNARPVHARKSTIRYRTRKFFRRHRWGVLSVAIIILALTGGLIGTLWQAGVAKEERDIAQREALKTQAVQEYLVGLFEAADPANSQGEPVTAQEIVRRGIEQLEENFDTEPEIHIEMLKVLGRVEQALGNFSVSTDLLDKALNLSHEIYGENHLNSAVVAAMLGDAARWAGNLGRAENLLREALEIRRRLIREDHAEIAVNMDRLARVLEMRGEFSEAEILYREALAMRERLFGEDSDAVAANLSNLGWLLFEMGTLDGAEEALRRSLDLRVHLIESPHPALASTMNNLAVVLRAKSNYEEAEKYFQQALDQERQLHGNDHPRVTTAMSNLSVMYVNLARYEEAANQYRQVLENNRRQLGPTHIYVGFALGHLATALTGAGQTEEALSLIDEAETVFRNAVGENHRFYARMLMIRGDALFYQDPEKAVYVFEHSVDTYRQIVDPNHPDLARSLTGLGRAQFAIGGYYAAEKTFGEALKIQREVLPWPHSDTAWTQVLLGYALIKQKRFEEAEPILREAKEALFDVLQPNHWKSIKAQLGLASCLVNNGLLATGKEETEQVLSALQNRTDFHAIRLMLNAAELYEQLQNRISLDVNAASN